MHDSEKMIAVDYACAQVRQAKSRAWNNFCALKDDPLHKQFEVLLLGMDLDTLHEVRSIVRENPEGTEEAIALLECLQSTIFSNITNCILCITETVAQQSGSMTDGQRGDIKHGVEGSLVLAAGSVRELLKKFDINILTASEL